MFQAFAAWSKSPNQKCHYVGILIGPYLTVMVSNHPPSYDQGNRPSFIASSSHSHPENDNMDNKSPGSGNDVENEESHYLGGQHLCDVFPQENAPQLVIYMAHILKEPDNWRAGLSAPLQCLFHLATINIVKNFEPGIIQGPSNIFSFERTPQIPFDTTVDEEVKIITVGNSLELNKLAFTAKIQ